VITRQRLLTLKKEVKNPDYGFSSKQAQLVHTLIDQCLLLQDRVDGGEDQRDWAAERARMDNQVYLALADVDRVLDDESCTDRQMIHKARYVTHCMQLMLKAKTEWARTWAHYRPMIEEEFS
jgi:hypothetical protein